MNLVELFTVDGPMHIDITQLAGTRKLLTIYTADGHRLKDVGVTADIREWASSGVHRDNLFASQELADDASDAFYRTHYGQVPDRHPFSDALAEAVADLEQATSGTGEDDPVRTWFRALGARISRKHPEDVRTVSAACGIVRNMQSIIIALEPCRTDHSRDAVRFAKRVYFPRTPDEAKTLADGEFALCRLKAMILSEAKAAGITAQFVTEPTSGQISIPISHVSDVVAEGDNSPSP